MPSCLLARVNVLLFMKLDIRSCSYTNCLKVSKLPNSARQLPSFARQIQNISGLYSMLFIILIRSKYFIKVNPIMILTGRKAK